MSQDLFTSSPMGGSQVPYRDMQAQPNPQVTPQPAPGAQLSDHPVTPSPVNKNKKFLIIGGSIAVGVVILLLIIILVILATRKDTVIQVIKETPAPTPTPAPDNSGLPKEISAQVNDLEVRINTTDITELEMTYPQLDWNLEF